MSQGRHSIKVLGLSLLAALGLMAFAASAQAGEYKIEGKTFTEKGVASETFEATIAKGKLLIPGLVLTFACTGGTVSGTVLLGGTIHATALFLGCEVEGNKFCKFYETKAKMETELEADRGFFVASGLGEVVLMGGKHYVLFSSGATPFTTIYFTKPAKGCNIGLEQPISGSAVFLAPNALTPSVNQTLSTMTQAELEALFPSDILSFLGIQNGWLNEGGTTNAHLSGANVGKTWGGE